VKVILQPQKSKHMYLPTLPFEDLTAEQLLANKAAAGLLQKGKRYEFEPFVSATGIPMPTSGLEPDEFKFRLGQYLGYKDDKHIFQGYPINDTRKINLKRKLCFFHVLFVGGAKIIPHS
jgi:hypothetical protein